MTEILGWNNEQQKVKPVNKEQEAKTNYLKGKEALCSSTKNKLNELKQECSIEKPEEKESDLKEILDQTINEIINNYLKDINSTEGINFSREWIYKAVIDVFEWLWRWLEKDNVFIKDIELIKNNFLLPKEKWLSLVDFAINEKFNNDKKNLEFVDINDDNVEEYFNVLKSTLWALYDIWKKSTPEEMNNYINEFKNSDEVKEIFDNFPDLEKIIFDIVPTFVNSVPKEKFISSIWNFLDSITGDIIAFSSYMNSKAEINKDQFNTSKLNVLNNSSKFLRSLINKDNVNVFSNKLYELKLVADNKVVDQLLGIVNWENFSEEDKLLLTDKVLEWVEIFSNIEITDENINEYINSLMWLISKLSKNIPNKKLLSLINSLKWWEETWDNVDVDLNLKELWNFLWKNKGNLINISWELLNRWYEWKNVSLNKLIIELFKNDIISNKLSILWEKLVENLRKITKIDLTKYALDFRKQFLSYNFWWKEVTKEKKEKLTQIEWDLISTFWWKLEKSVSELVIWKINSKENNNLKKEEIIWVVLKDLKSFLKLNSEKVFEYAEELWYKVEGEQDRKNILNIINSVLDNPKLTNIISIVIENLWKELSWKTDIVKELDLLIKDALENKWWVILEGTEKNTKDLAFDTFYNNVLWNKENIQTVLNLFWGNFELPKEIDWNTITKVSQIFKKYLDKNTLSGLINKIDIDNPTKDIKEISIWLYKWIKDKTWFISELLDIWIIDKVKSLWWETNNESENISIENVNIWIDLLYTTFESADKKDMSETLNNILTKSGLWEITNMTILWKNMWENIVSFLSSVEKNELKTFLWNNIEVLNKLLNWNLSENEKIVIYSNLSTDLIKIIDIKKFQKEYYQEDLDSNEKLGLDLADEFKEVLSEKWYLIKSLVSKAKDISDIYNWTIDISQVDPEIIKSYWKEVFDLLHSVISKIDKKYLWKNMKFSEGWWKNEVLDMFISSFMWENKWFIVKEWISWVFAWFEINKWESIDTYFRESDNNRENFGDTIYDFLVSKTEK